MAPPFRDNPAKVVVRTVWDTPLLRYLHQEFNVRYRYLGLPGVELIDVELWRDMIDEVIAFEPPSRPPNPRQAIAALRRNMKLKDIRGSAYCGSFEEVVMLRRDLDGQHYAQPRFVTLYNLDFCDELTSRVDTRTGPRVLRFEAIRQILRDQATCYLADKSTQHFILLLTARNQTSADKLHALLGGVELLAQVKSHQDICEGLNPIPDTRSNPLVGTHTWALKTAVFNHLLGWFNNPCLSVLFFPLMMYNGTPVTLRSSSGTSQMPSPMLHWVILCKFAEPEQSAVDSWPRQYLQTACVSVTNEGDLAWSPQAGETGTTTGRPDIVSWLNQHGEHVLRGLA
jgi:hypothetical protein